MAEKDKTLEEGEYAVDYEDGLMKDVPIYSGEAENQAENEAENEAGKDSDRYF